MLTEEMRRYYASAIKWELWAFRATRFVNKNPAHCLRLRWLNAMFPDAQYILIKRDPIAVVHSIYQKMLMYWGTQLRTEYEHGYKGYVTIKDVFGMGLTRLETCLNFYNYNKSILEKDLHIIGNSLITVNYEDLVAAPREHIARLYRFAGLEWYDELEDSIPEKLATENNRKWQGLPPEERKLLEEEFTSDSSA
jgi:hypothetical protein